MMTRLRSFFVTLVLCCCPTFAVTGQVECAGPGNLRGIRVDGDLMAFTSSIRVATTNAVQQGQGGRGRPSGQFHRDGVALTVTGNLTGGLNRRFGPPGFRATPPSSGVSYQATYTDVGPGSVEAVIQVNAHTNSPMRGVFYAFSLPAADFADASAQWIGPESGPMTTTTLSSARSGGTNLNLRATAKGVRVATARRQFELNFPGRLQLAIRDAQTRGGSDVEISFPLCLGDLTNQQTVRSSFSIKASGEVDNSPVMIATDWSRPGRVFDGMGGNFRLQSPNDPAQIQYNLDHLRVAWGRVALPWNQWQPDQRANPTNAPLDNYVLESMDMARKLSDRKIPIIISVWFPPAWAVLTNGANRLGRAPIDPARWDEVCHSIGSYLVYLRDHYHAEPELFSFNESDLGINVLQTPQEHADAIKRLGTWFASHGLKTRMLLGDTGNPTGDKFIDVAANDPEAVKFIGAVSFHSWLGGTEAQYQHFGEAARRLKVPLLVAEGGVDPSAHMYSAVFREPWYCIDEIAQYVEICRVAEPLCIMPWQLTTDYSILAGGTVGRPLEPTQRFWQIKQLEITAPGATAVPVRSNNPKVIACAFADHAACVVHLVNNGAAREATVTGLPLDTKNLRLFVTDSQRGMQESGPVPVKNGTAQLQLDSMTFTTLTSSDRP